MTYTAIVHFANPNADYRIVVDAKNSLNAIWVAAERLSREKSNHMYIGDFRRV